MVSNPKSCSNSPINTSTLKNLGIWKHCCRDAQVAATQPQSLRPWVFVWFQIKSWDKAVVVAPHQCSGRSSHPLRGGAWCHLKAGWWWSRGVVGVAGWVVLTKCRKLFSWRGFQPLDWGEIAFSAPRVLGSASLEFPPWKMACECQINKSSGSVHCDCSPLSQLDKSRVWKQRATCHAMSEARSQQLLTCMSKKVFWILWTSRGAWKSCCTSTPLSSLF